MNPIKGNRKVLVPLATMLAAGAVAIGSGATFSSQSAHTVAVTAGHLHQTNSHNGQTLTVDNIKPGDSQSGTLTITNDGSLDAALALKPTSESSTFDAGALNLKIMQGTTVVYNGDFSGLGTPATWNLGTLTPTQSTTVTYTVSMDAAAGNTNQGATASAGFEYDATQTGGNSSISWLP